MKKSRRIMVVLAALVLIIFCSSCSKTGVEKPDETPVVKKMVESYMTALKDKNVKEIISMSGIKVKDEIKEQLITGATKFFGEVIDLDIKSYEIKEIKVEGSIAFVTVEENRKIAPKEEAPPGMDTDYKTVTETIVLIKRDGKWKIDGMNTLHLSEMDMDSPEKAIEQFNKMGVARLFSVVTDPDVANIGFIAAAILAPNFLKAKGQGQFTQCQSNLKNIGTALEMYSTDNSGHYPDSLSKLTPDYFRVMPTCGSAGKDTYLQSYQFNLQPDAYTFYCSGHNHSNAGVGPNFPQYNSTMGLISQ